METSTTLAPGTRTRYAYEVRRFAKIMEATSLEEITPALLLEWNTMLHDAGGATGTVVQKHSALVKFFSFLEEFQENEHAGRLLRAMRRLSPPRATPPRRQPYALTEDQVHRIAEAAGRRPGVGVRDRAMVLFFWSTGVRRFELLSVKAPDVDLENRVATVTGKRNKQRTVVFDEETREALAQWLSIRPRYRPECENVFMSVMGGPLNEGSIGPIIKEAARRARVRKKVWTHLFRHTRITELLDGGMSLQDTAAFAGHNNINTTMRYFHERPEELRRRYDRATVDRPHQD
jgi:integrase/recombinase XerC